MNPGHTSERLPESGDKPKPSEEIQHERQRIARLLHDTVCQEITGIGLMVHVLANRQRAQSPALAQQLMEIAEMIQHAGKTTHEIMRGLQGEN